MLHTFTALSKPVVAFLSDKVFSTRLFAGVFGVALLIASSKFTVPFYPVPVTMQVFVVLLLPVLYGPMAIVSVLAYLGLGLAGLPVFAGSPERGLGLAYILGPTGGYLLGFFLASLFLNFMLRLNSQPPAFTRALVLLAGIGCIYAPGVIVLFSYLQSWEKAFALGITPFILSDVLKALVVLLLWPVCRKNTAKTNL